MNAFRWANRLSASIYLMGSLFISTSHAISSPRPNIIVIVADDLGYGELGCYGQKVILTPRLDQMAREGTRFTQFYSGATVCAPSRSVLITGQHGGRTRVRGNAGPNNPIAQALRAEDVTVAEVLREAGYTTALVGKWGLGDFGPAESGLPRRQGFDFFYGFLSQVHAHNHYPEFLWRNETKEPLPNRVVPVGTTGAGFATNAIIYAGDRFTEEALRWVAEPRQQPFFLLWCPIAPHANNERKAVVHNGAEVPDFGPYADRPWSDPNKGHAAMITRLDAQVGQLLDQLRRQQIERNTLVLFTSDNGPHRESNHDPDRFFQPSGAVRGYKRDLTDGGIRVPLIAWWPGRIPPGKTTDRVGYFGDLLATAAELAGVPPPKGIDSISLVPTLLGQPTKQRQHEFLYWEFHESGFSQAVLLDRRWKAIRMRSTNAPIQLYDLRTDPREVSDLARMNPTLVARAQELFRTVRIDSPDWPIQATR